MKSNISLFIICFGTLVMVSCHDRQEKKITAKAAVPTTDSLQLVLNMLQTDSLNADLWKLQYQLFLEKNDTVKAMRSLRRYNYLAPEDGDGWLEMAWLLADRKDPGALVITDSLALVKDDMIRTRARYIRGLYFANMQQDDKALEEFDSTIIHNYTFIDAYIEKGIILYNHKKFEEALLTFQQAFRIVNNNAELYYWIGKCYEGLGNTAEAADWQQKYEALK